MAGHTNRLNLYLPGGGSSGLYLPDEQLDVDRINDNMKLIDAAVGFEVVTSGTRPASPFPGKGIFETDTKRLRLWDGATWVASNAERGTSALFTAADATAMGLITGAAVIAGDLCSLASDTTLHRYNGTTWVIVGGLLRPSSAAATGGTSTTNNDGSVTTVFTGAGNVIINGVFSALAAIGRDSADVELGWIGSGSTITMKLANGGVPDASTNQYDDFGMSANQAGVYSGATVLAQPAWILSNGQTPVDADHCIELRHVNDASRRTRGFWTGTNLVVVGTTEYHIRGNMTQRASAAWDGFQVLVSAAGTLTIKVKARS